MEVYFLPTKTPPAREIFIQQLVVSSHPCLWHIWDHMQGVERLVTGIRSMHEVQKA